MLFFFRHASLYRVIHRCNSIIETILYFWWDVTKMVPSTGTQLFEFNDKINLLKDFFENWGECDHIYFIFPI